MPRQIWKGVITFGMVSIPVGLYAATESKDVAFHQLHKPCNSRVKQRRWCPVCEDDVEMAEIVKGYEYSKDQYVILAEADFESLPVPSKHTIELSAFVEQTEIDPVYHEKTYYLEPEETGIKAYALLMRALESKSLSALAKVAIRTKERLCALRPQEGILVMDTLFWPDEIRAESRPRIPDVIVNERELTMAQSLIELLHEEFQPQKYGDAYREALLGIIESKVQSSEAVTAPVVAAPSANITDLMAALKASVEAMQQKKKEKVA
jgi:DNA end-binding protein Ku